jgi:hypothetical protein
MAITYNNIFPPKFAQIWIFGLKRKHLATLLPTQESPSRGSFNVMYVRFENF